MQKILLPTQRFERIESLDFLRGVAILGILLINVETFSYPEPWSSFKYGFENSIDRSARFWIYFLAQGKFFSMFTLLFGVGFYIFLERLEQKGLGLKSMDIYARRLLWLFVIGVIHAYLIWDGDILYHYAICGFILFPFRSFSVKQLLLTLLIPVIVLLYNSYERTSSTKNQFVEYTQAIRVRESLRVEEENEKIERWENRIKEKTTIESKTEPIRKAYYQSVAENFNHTEVHKGTIFYPGIFFRTLIMMILGITLYKLGIFENYKSLNYYWLITILILLVALIVNYVRYYHWTYEYFHPVKDVWLGWLFTFPKEALGLAYVLLLNGIYQKYLKRIKFNPISDAGKAALTNYIMQSIICGFIFYGYGLEKHNLYSRSELPIVVLIVLIFQLAVSWFWMRKFKYGPLEWVWRTLTYRTFKQSQ